MFRVEVENPPEDVQQSQIQAQARELESQTQNVHEDEQDDPEMERNQYLDNLRRTTIAQPVVRGPRPKAASSDWG